MSTLRCKHSQVKRQTLAEEAHKFQVLALTCQFEAMSSYWERSKMQLPWLQLILSPQENDFFSVWGTTMGNAQTGCKMCLFFPKPMSFSVKQCKHTQTPDHTAASWSGLTKDHFSTVNISVQRIKPLREIYYTLNNLHCLQNKRWSLCIDFPSVFHRA